MNELYKELKEMCNKIVGYWYCDEIQQQFIFYLNDRLLKESKLIIINKETFETVYGVAVKTTENLTTCFYFDIGKFDKRYYEILALTKDKLVIREFYMIPNTPPSEKTFTYIRKVDISIAEEILKGID